MPRLELDLDDPTISQRLFAAWDTAGLLLVELAKRGATKAEIDALEKEMLSRYSDMEKTEKGIPGLIKIDIRAVEKAMQETVKSIFERVTFR